jgi:hypothetical protein
MSTTRPAAIVVSVMALVAVAGGYAVGGTAAPSASEAQAARDQARIEATKEASRLAFLQGRRRGVAAGLSEGRARGRREGAKNGQAAGELKAAGQQVSTGPSSSTSQPGPGAQGSLFPKDGPAPSVDSPQGRRALQHDPDCRGHPPPPPGYHGPVQC